MRINAGWPAVHGRPNILAVPIAGSLTPRQGSSIQTSIPAVSAVRFAGAKSARGLAITIFSIGKSIRRSRPSLGKDGGDQKEHHQALVEHLSLANALRLAGPRPTKAPFLLKRIADLRRSTYFGALR